MALVMIFVFSLVFADRFHFRTVGSSQGLSQASAISIWQDNLGRMWFGNDALNCYNGTTSKVYRVSEYFPGLEDSDIHAICGDDSTLYFLAQEYIVGLDLTTDRFFSSGIKAVDIGVVDGRLYYTSPEGELCVYDRFSNESRKLFDLRSKNGLIYHFKHESGHVFWLGTSSGLYKVDISSEVILSSYFEGSSISCLFKDSNGNLWVSSRTGTTRIIRPNGHVTTLVYKNNAQPFVHEAYSFAEDSKGMIWLGTLNGLYQVTPPLREAPALVEQEVFMAEFSIYALYTDRQGTIWIGPYYGEVRYFNPETDNYTLYISRENDPNSIHGVVLGDILEDTDDYLYISSEGSGVNLVSPDRSEIRHLTVASHKLPHDKIRSMYFDSKYKQLYIGTYMEGLVYYDRTTDQVYPVQQDSLKTRYQRIIEEIIPYGESLILLTQDGLFKMNRQTKHIVPLFNDSELRKLSSGITRTIYLDDRNVLWVSSLLNGLFTVDMNNSQLLASYGDGLRDKTLIPSPVINICGNSKQGLYFATLKSGVLGFDTETGEFESYSVDDGLLLSNICYKVALSAYGNLIVTSNKGVSMLHMSGRRIIHSSNHIRLDGTSPIMSLSPDCGLYVSPRDRKIYVGGLQKVIAFDEKDISTVKSSYRLYISSIQVNNTPSEDLDPFLKESPTRLKELELPFNKNTINITFASSNYLSSYYTSYEYKMEGLTGLNEWTHTDYTNISFASLPAGSYLFTVRETSDPEKTVSLHITIKPPFWKSYPAYFLYLLFVTGLLWLFVRSSKAKALLHASLEYQKKEAERVKEENKNRLNFFAGIANEFRTPLTLIITTLDRLLSDFNSVSKSKLERIRKQALRMQSLFVELQEFREAENGILRLKAGYYSLTQLLQEIHDMISDYESTLQITFNYYHPGEDVKVWFDWEQMQKVIYNLLFAISKLVRVKGRVDIALKTKASSVEVQISCAGEVYDEETLLQMFDVFENAAHSTDSPDTISSLPNNVIGLAFSRKIIAMHKGELLVHTEKDQTSFIIRLQMGESHLSSDEKTGTTTDVMLRQLPAFLDIPDYPTEQVIDEIKDNQPEKGLKLLLIDNDDELRTVLRDSFVSVYDVYEATRAEEALEMAIQEQPDIIISEISLTGMSGIELCSTLKANIKTLHIPVLLITTHPSMKQQYDSVRAGAEEYLVKPFSMEYLFLRCNSLVKNQASIRQKYTGRLEEDAQVLATNQHDQRFLDKAVQILEKNIEDTDFDTTVWSKELGIGRTRLFDRIKRITGMTPNDYILQFKMNKAMGLLREHEELTISEIAYKLGFSNPAYFSKCFKKQVGVTPQQYRKK